MMKRFPLVLLILAVALVASAQVYDSSGRQKVNAETGTVAVTGTVTANAGTGTLTVGQSNEALLKATVYAGSSWSITPSFTDNSSTTNVMPFAALYDTSPPSITDGNAGIPRMTSTRVLMVDGSATTQPVSGTFWQATQPVSGTFWQATQPVSIAAAVTVAQATAANLNATVTDGSGALTVDGTVTANQGGAPWSMAISQTTTNNDVDVTTFPDNEPINVAQKGGATVIAGPCEREVPLYAQVSQTGGAQVIAGTASERVYVCSIAIVTATAQNIALVDGTGAVCVTSPTGLLGGSTAATGQNFAVNGGWVLPFNPGGWAKTSSDADNVCLLQSGAGQVSGIVTYVSVPNI